MAKIFIIGAGALGLMYGLRLARGGVPVTMITRSFEQAELLRTQGGQLVQARRTIDIKIEAVSIGEIEDMRRSDLPQRDDWVWFAVKQPHMTQQLLKQAAGLLQHRPSVLCLQNGIGHLELLKEALPGVEPYAGVSTEGAMRISLTEASHTGEGTLVFGPFSPGVQLQPDEEHAQKMLVNTLSMAGIAVSLSKEMMNRIYEKLLINAVINPLTAIYGVKNGELPSQPGRLQLMRALHQESEAVLVQAGMKHSVETWDRLLAVCAATAANESSMLRDVLAGRQTEIDWINGGISALAKRFGLCAPLNDAVTVMVKALN